MDLQRVGTDHDALDEQLQESLLVREGGGIQPVADPLTEGRQIGEDGLGREPLLPEADLLGTLRFQALALLGHVRPPLGELFQADDFGLVGVQQSLIRSAQPLQAGGQPASVRLLRLIPFDRLQREASKLGEEAVGLTQELTNVRPDRGLELRGPYRWTRAQGTSRRLARQSLPEQW